MNFYKLKEEKDAKNKKDKRKIIRINKKKI